MTGARPRVLLLGATGFLGSYLLRRLPASFATVAVVGRTPAPRESDRVEWLPMSLDVARRASTRAVVTAARADVVVNAIGAIPPADDAAAMATVNSRFPQELSAAADHCGARVVHISTDAVFSGARGAYTEQDEPDPSDEYGRSKLAGEIGPPHITLRTSFFGMNPRGRGLIEWLRAQHGPKVGGFADYRFTGVSAVVLADLIADAIDHPGLEGVYHVGGDPMSKYELLAAAAARLDLPVNVVPTLDRAVNRTLDSSRFFAALGRQRPTLADSIDTLASCGTLSHS